MSNYLESVRLYPIDTGITEVGIPGPFDIFCSIDDIPRLAAWTSESAVLLLVGRRSAKTEDVVLSCAESFMSVRYLDGPDFTFHSDVDDVVKLIEDAKRQGVRPLVFHNFAKRVRKALALHLGDERVDVITSRWLALD